MKNGFDRLSQRRELIGESRSQSLSRDDDLTSSSYHTRLQKGCKIALKKSNLRMAKLPNKKGEINKKALKHTVFQGFK